MRFGRYISDAKSQKSIIVRHDMPSMSSPRVPGSLTPQGAIARLTDDLGRGTSRVEFEPTAAEVSPDDRSTRSPFEGGNTGEDAR